MKGISHSALGTRRSAVARRFGYVIGSVVNGVLLYGINVAPGWRSLPFLADGFEQGNLQRIVAPCCRKDLFFKAGTDCDGNDRGGDRGFLQG